ncbi:MAG: hypothetical protein ACUBOA_05155 [Candidatus Loosdrechtia sp.]|uniref:hypothetical protein n=1 Tax=Candidatus Loosdrechtia sp. TaxID=3101272 RepID=UPI003A709425|nr:MAG: hypothetical protein QY305_14070 [Candidatus Jettenia sp. AMX2]
MFLPTIRYKAIVSIIILTFAMGWITSCAPEHPTNGKPEKEHPAATEKPAEEKEHPEETRAVQPEDEHPVDTQRPEEEEEHPAETKSLQHEEEHPAAVEKPAEENEHPEETRAVPSENEHPAGTEKLAEEKEHPLKAVVSAEKITLEDVANVVEEFIADYTEEDIFLHYDETTGEWLELMLDKVHHDKLVRTKEDEFVICAEFEGVDGKMYNLDFFVRGKTKDELQVDEDSISVHKVDGKERYTWKYDEKEGLWEKHPVSAEREHPKQPEHPEHPK